MANQVLVRVIVYEGPEEWIKQFHGPSRIGIFRNGTKLSWENGNKKQWVHAEQLYKPGDQLPDWTGITTAVEAVCHIWGNGGGTLCRMKGEPWEWPAGHNWVPIKQVKESKKLPDHCCPICSKTYGG